MKLELRLRLRKPKASPFMATRRAKMERTARHAHYFIMFKVNVRSSPSSHLLFYRQMTLPRHTLIWFVLYGIRLDWEALEARMLIKRKLARARATNTKIST